MDIKLTRLNILETQSVLLRRCARESVHRLFVTTDSGNEKRRIALVLPIRNEK